MRVCVYNTTANPYELNLIDSRVVNVTVVIAS